MYQLKEIKPEKDSVVIVYDLLDWEGTELAQQLEQAVPALRQWVSVRLPNNRVEFKPPNLKRTIILQRNRIDWQATPTLTKIDEAVNTLKAFFSQVSANVTASGINPSSILHFDQPAHHVMKVRFGTESQLIKAFPNGNGTLAVVAFEGKHGYGVVKLSVSVPEDEKDTTMLANFNFHQDGADWESRVSQVKEIRQASDEILRALFACE